MRKWCYGYSFITVNILNYKPIIKVQKDKLKIYIHSFVKNEFDFNKLLTIILNP